MSEVHRAVGDVDAWVRALVRTTPARVQWDRVILAGVGITGPVALALVLAPHDDTAIGAGALASMGALVVSAMDVGVAGSERVHRVAFATAVATIGFALGTVVHGHAVLTFFAVIVAGFLSGLSGAISATASKSAIYFLMFAVMASNVEFGLASAWTGPLVFCAGAVWRVMLTVVAASYTGRKFGPERRSVARVFSALADQLAAESTTARDRAGVALTGALNDAYDVLVAARTDLASHDRRWQTLVSLLNASAPVVDAVTAWKENGEDVDTDAVLYLRAVAAWIASAQDTLPPTYDPARKLSEAKLTASLSEISQDISGIAVNGGAGSSEGLSLPERPSVRARLRAAERALTSGTELWGSILRLVLCLAVAQGLCIAWQLERPYLVMLTVAQVMKPDFGSVLGRAMQRGMGTLIGVAIGSLAVMYVPRGEWQILVIFLLAASIPILMPRNYGLYAMVTTPLAVLLVELHVSDSSGLLSVRLRDTLLGCAIVLVLGYLPWPQTWRAPRNFAGQVAVLVRSIGSYADAALRRPDDTGHETARRDIYRHISNLRTTVGQSLAEPPIISAATASWLPEIAALERVTDAITAVVIDGETAGRLSATRDVDAVCAALEDLADAITARRPPTDHILLSHEFDALAGELAGAQSALVAQQRSAGTHHRTGG